MNNSKRIVTILLILVLLFTVTCCLFSCDEDEDVESTESTLQSSLDYDNPVYPTLPTDKNGALILPDDEI